MRADVRGGRFVGEGGFQEFPLTPEIDWWPVVAALVLGAVIAGAAVALYLRRRRRRAGPELTDEQDYCDWCYSTVSSSARQRSAAIGLTSEYSLACERCLASGRYRDKPGGWDNEAEWPWAAPPDDSTA